MLDVSTGYSNFGFFAVWPGEASREPFRAVQYWTVNGVFADPEPVSLDGHDGLYLELRVPGRVDFGRCTDGSYMLWEGRPGDAQHPADSPGSVERVWLLDVDGERVVLTAIAAGGVPRTRVHELAAMVESVRFVEVE